MSLLWEDTTVFILDLFIGLILVNRAAACVVTKVKLPLELFVMPPSIIFYADTALSHSIPSLLCLIWSWFFCRLVGLYPTDAGSSITRVSPVNCRPTLTIKPNFSTSILCPTIDNAGPTPHLKWIILESGSFVSKTSWAFKLRWTKFKIILHES